jgi:hypothetical protein
MSARTPPYFDVPARFTWRSASPLRSTPGLLRAPDGGDGEILVKAGQKFDVVGVKQRSRAMHLRVDSAQWRAAITCDETGGVEFGAAVALFLHQQQTHDSLSAGQQDSRTRQVEAIGKRLSAIGGAGLQVAGDAVRHAITLLRGTAWRLLERAENAKNDEERGRLPERDLTYRRLQSGLDATSVEASPAAYFEAPLGGCLGDSLR